MKRFKDKGLRLQGFDYSTDGAYFITIVTKNRVRFFGEIKDGSMQLSLLGKICAEEWQKTNQLNADIEIDEWVIMPDHFHAIIWVSAEMSMNMPPVYRGLPQTPNYKAVFGQVPRLSRLINQFKGGVTRKANCLQLAFGWQKKYHDRILRNETELLNARKYIQKIRRIGKTRRDCPPKTRRDCPRAVSTKNP